MVVNSFRGASDSTPRAAADRSQLTSRWNMAYGGEPTIPLGPGYGPFDGGPPMGALYHSVHHPLVAAADGSPGYGTKFSSGAGAESYGGSSGPGGYDYHSPPVGPSGPHIIHHPLPPAPPPFLSTPSFGKPGSRRKGAALSALTLLAFLYFLNLLQNCLKEHMVTMNPTVMVMTSGATRRKDISSEGDRSSEQEDPRAGSDEAALVDEYEALTGHYELLTSSNRSPNPYLRRSTEAPYKKPETPVRHPAPQWYGPDHAGSDWQR
ncbi:uncharacterized protein LOC131207530 [Anopheles bellator]|uniref:uncharacterized protein LOC131207530 n=1 Tax=Anopheles bellator TaxID=139047 RepID=UPI0026498436|nr:uncharacterized protein LOC131207530 [Anopheles bellator]